MRIVKGIQEKNIDQLINYTNRDGDVKKFTSDLKRFLNREALNEWLKKGRKIYTLIDDGDNLLGITWFGPEGDGFTFAIRMYEDARGKGLAADFLSATMNDYMTEPEYVNSSNKNWWLETSVDNYPAIKIYEQLGFVKSGQGQTSDKIICRRDFGYENVAKKMAHF